MKTEKLDLSHKELLYDRLKSIDTAIAEYSFANLYLFRKNHQYEVIIDREIFIKGITYDSYSYLMPTSDIRRTDREYLKELVKSVHFLFPIPEEWLEAFDRNEFEFSSAAGDADYMYTVEKMSTYRGRRLHKKRNLLKQFTTLYNHEAFPLTTGRLDHAVSILRAWQEESGAHIEEADFYPCMEAIRLYDELVLCGGIYYADREPAGFIIGEELNQETFVLHFAKGRIKYTGIYQYMFNNFARILPSKYHFMNLEQDLDRETLRHAKTSYVPDIMVKKFRVSLKK
jgi:hypothetical protein